MIDILTRREITFLSPASWDDKNDSLCMEIYKDKNQISALFALCFSAAPETYHHWKIFSGGSSGVCIKFNENKLLKWVAGHTQLVARPVGYRTLKSIRITPPSLIDLPFTKRHAFRDEKEFRIIVRGNNPSERIATFSMPLDLIEGLTVNPWVPRTVFQSMKTLLRQIPGCAGLKIVHSTVVTNKEWGEAANAAV